MTSLTELRSSPARACARPCPPMARPSVFHPDNGGFDSPQGHAHGPSVLRYHQTINLKRLGPRSLSALSEHVVLPVALYAGVWDELGFQIRAAGFDSLPACSRTSTAAPCGRSCGSYSHRRGFDSLRCDRLRLQRSLVGGVRLISVATRVRFPPLQPFATPSGRTRGLHPRSTRVRFLPLRRLMQV